MLERDWKTPGEFGARIIGPTKSRLSSYVVFEKIWHDYIYEQNTDEGVKAYEKTVEFIEKNK